jgi:hypothetical protein
VDGEHADREGRELDELHAARQVTTYRRLNPMASSGRG